MCRGRSCPRISTMRPSTSWSSSTAAGVRAERESRVTRPLAHGQFAHNESVRRRYAMTQTIDETKLEQLMGQLVGHMTGAALCFGMWLGDELGLYRKLT